MDTEGSIKNHIGVGLSIGIRLGGAAGPLTHGTIVDVAAGPQWIDIESLTRDGDPVTGGLLHVTVKFDTGFTMSWPTPGDTFVAWCHKQRYGA